MPKHLEIKENMDQRSSLNDKEHLWNAEKAVFEGKYTALNTHVRKQI